jgi:hypothetical protein
VKKDVPRMNMVHHQDVTVELITHLLAAQREIHHPGVLVDDRVPG